MINTISNNEHMPMLSLNDVAIMPAKISEINHRSECDVTYKNGKLPIFTAPMPCVVNCKTFNNYEKCGINAIMPRTEPYSERVRWCLSDGKWCAFSLEEFEDLFTNNYCLPSKNTNTKYNVLVDIANGNMQRLYNAVKQVKSHYKNKIVIMVGNIANPETFREYCKIGVDYVRISVGSGTGCTSATNLGIYYPMASLIDECAKIKENEDFENTKIIADGGLVQYRDMIKALALGADYIMLGSALNKLTDSAGEVVNGNKVYYGMASEKGMELLGKHGSCEGKIVNNICKGTIKSFTEDFTNYLRSAMSYTNRKTLNDFIGNVELNYISYNSSRQFNQEQ